MVWNKESILAALKKLNKQDKDLSYNALARSNQSLVSAAAYHFGSYRKAVEKAGIDYAEVTRRPRWTKQLIIALIKKAYKDDADLHWSAVTKRRDELGRAAFASLQPRLFGSWDRALHGAGLDADEISRYRTWNKSSIVFDLKALAKEGEPLNSGALQQADPGLHAAAVRHFGSYEKALKAANVDPMSVRRRRSWTREQVLKELRGLKRSGSSLADSSVRRENPALYGAALRLFGTFTAARDAAGIKLKASK
jgi:hypothetical protein